jgi:protocadherin delta 1
MNKFFVWLYHNVLIVFFFSDQRFPQFSDTAIVNVNVADLNDNDPEFGDSCRDINIPENSEQEYIHTLIAHDQDEGNNGKLTYKFARPSSPFVLDADTGKLSTPPLDR